MKAKEMIILLGQCEPEYEVTVDGRPIVSLTQLKYETNTLKPSKTGLPEKDTQSSYMVTLQVGSVGEDK